MASALRDTGLSSFEFDDPTFQADPYPVYAWLRENEPISLRTGDGVRSFWVTRHEHVMALLREPRLSAAREIGGMLQPDVPLAFRRLGELLSHMMLNKDEPDHMRLRGLVNRAFVPRIVEGLRPRVESIVDGLLSAVMVRGHRKMDIIRDLATPLPVIVIAELLGVPTEDQGRFKAWSDDIAVVLDGSVRAAGLPAAARSAGELSEYLRDVIRQRRR